MYGRCSLMTRRAGAFLTQHARAKAIHAKKLDNKRVNNSKAGSGTNVCRQQVQPLAAPVI